MPGSKISNAPGNNKFAAAFMDLKLSRESKEDFLEVKESKAGTELQDG